MNDNYLAPQSVPYSDFPASTAHAAGMKVISSDREKIYP